MDRPHSVQDFRGREFRPLGPSGEFRKEELSVAPGIGRTRTRGGAREGGEPASKAESREVTDRRQHFKSWSILSFYLLIFFFQKLR